MDVAMLTLVAPSLLTMACLLWSYLLYLPWRCVRLVVLTLLTMAVRTPGRTVPIPYLRWISLALTNPIPNPNPNLRWISRAPRTWGEVPR